MVEHPSQYPWSSYGVNAREKESDLVEPHEIYMRLGTTNKSRQQAYRELFKIHIGENSLMEIRETTNKAWVLGNGRFKQEIEAMTTRQISPKARGGDRRSEKFRDERKINRV